MHPETEQQSEKKKYMNKKPSHQKSFFLKWVTTREVFLWGFVWRAWFFRFTCEFYTCRSIKNIFCSFCYTTVDYFCIYRWNTNTLQSESFCSLIPVHLNVIFFVYLCINIHFIDINNVNKSFFFFLPSFFLHFLCWFFGPCLSRFEAHLIFLIYL